MSSGFHIGAIEFSDWVRSNAAWSKDNSEATLSLFLFPKSLLRSEQKESDHETIEQPRALSLTEADTAALATKGLTCLTCTLLFSNSIDQRQHFKSSYHLFNLKRQLKKVESSPISLEEYAAIISKLKSCGHGTESLAPKATFHDQQRSSVEEDGDVDDGSDEEDTYDGSFESDSDSYLSDGEDNQGSAQRSSHDRYLFDDGVITVENKKRHGPIISVFLADLKPWYFSVNVPSLRWARSYLDPCHSSDFSAPTLSPWARVQRFLGEVYDNPITIVFVLKSGRFVAIVMDKTRLVKHKTLRRYTVRAKAGGSQSSYDSKSGKAKSAGAMLRRHGEQSLKEDVGNLLKDWQPYLQSCSMILISAAKSIRPILFEENRLLNSSDPRIVSLPFVVRDATMEGAIAAHTRFFSVIFGRGDDSNINGAVVEGLDNLGTVHTTDSTTRLGRTGGNVAHENIGLLSAPPPAKDGASVPLLYPESHTLNQLCKNDTEDHITNFIDELSDCGKFTPEEVKIIVNTPDSMQTLNFPLHFAAERGLTTVIDMLLSASANLQSIDIRGRTAYSVAKDKNTRDAFRRYRGIVEQYDTTFDWSATGIPSALTESIEMTRRLKEKEKKKRQHSRKKEQKAANKQLLDDAKLATDLQSAEAAAWQQSLRAAEVAEAGVCAAPKCEISLYQNESFDVLGRRCCSAACVLNLRRHLAAEAALRRTQPVNGRVG